MLQQKYHILYVEYYVTVYVEYIRLYVNRRKAWGGRPPQGLGGGAARTALGHRRRR